MFKANCATKPHEDVKIIKYIDAFLMDPEISNTKAIHIYEKAGFRKIATFFPKKGYLSIEEHVLKKKP